MTELLLEPMRDELPFEPSAEEWTEPIDGYANLTLLGRGASGLMLRGRSLRFEREVAIKLLAPDWENHPNAAERFFNEARQTARLRHPQLARGIDCGRAGKYFFYAMEYIRGESVLAKLNRLQAHKFKDMESLRIVRQVSEALHYTYNLGLLPYDLKPNNLLLDPTGAVKITDFGVAKELAFASMEQWTLSIADYAAPEQAQGENPDVRSVLYALGCVWYQLLTGAPPFGSAAPSGVLVSQINEAPRPLNDPKISPATGQLVGWLLNKDRDKRPRSPQQFLSKLLTHPLVKLAAEKADNAVPPAPAENLAEPAPEETPAIVEATPETEAVPDE